MVPEMVLVAVLLPLQVEVMPTPWKKTAGVTMSHKVQSTKLNLLGTKQGLCTAGLAPAITKCTLVMSVGFNLCLADDIVPYKLYFQFQL